MKLVKPRDCEMGYSMGSWLSDSESAVFLWLGVDKSAEGPNMTQYSKPMGGPCC